MNSVLTDKIVTLYKELFTITFQHTAYEPPHQNFIAESITVRPDKDTKKKLVNYQMGYRFDTDTLVCYVQSKLFAPPAIDPKVPYIPFQGDVQLRFKIQVRSEFLEVTDVKAAGSAQVYYFSNRNHSGTGTFISRHATAVNDDDLEDVSVVLPEEACFGVIDIFNTGTSSNSYELFDGPDQKLKSPGFTISFKSLV